MEDQIFTPQETPTLDDVMNTEQEDVVYEPLDNVIDDEIHTQTEPSDVQIPESEEIETGEPIEVTIEDQIITPKKNRIDFQGYELDNISEADNENDVPSIKQVREIVEEVESEKQDKLTAGDNITITDNVISATDTTYTAGSGLTLTDTEFSVGTITNSMIDDNAVTSAKIDYNSLAPVNYVNDITNELGSYNNNEQAIYLFPNGMVYINISFLLTNNIAASVNAQVCVLPEPLQASKNWTLNGCSPNRTTNIYPYYRAGDHTLRFNTPGALTAGWEVNINGWYKVI